MAQKSLWVTLLGIGLALVAALWPAISFAACANPVFINEFHYDNTGTDTGEFIEIAGPAGTDLTGWSIVLYRGSGTPYGTTIALTGAIDDEGSGFGALSFPATLQNGPDGMALVDSTGVIRQFLSYEGSFTATSGPAAGQTSVTVGVVEGTTTPVGSSLQLLGGGDCADSFHWSGPLSASPGLINNGQQVSTVPQVVATSPTAGAYDVAIDAVIMVTVSEEIVVTGPVQINCTQSGVQSVTPTLSPPRTLQLPHANFSGGELCTVTIPADTVTDIDDTPDPLPTDYTWQFEVGYPRANFATPFISIEEAQNRTVVDAQDDAWRLAAQSVQSCPNFATGILQEATNVQCGDNIGDCALPSTLPSGLVISYTLRNMDGRTLGSADGWATGQMDGCGASSASLQDGAPRPTGVPGCYYNDAANLRGNNDNPNGVLFRFSQPLTAFGAWFGDLEGKPTGTSYYHGGSSGGSGIGGAPAYLRLFFENGAMQEVPIEPSLAPSAPWLAANAPPPASAVGSGGDIGYCGGENSTTDAVGCGNKTTRWVGFVADQPTNRVTQMLVVLGDDDHSGSGPSDGPNVTCAGGDARACNGGNEYLSFIGPTACILPDLTITKAAEPSVARAGEVITYTLTYSSVLPGIATGPITVTDNLPAGLTLLATISANPPASQIGDGAQWRVDLLPVNTTGQITFTARVGAALAGWLTNTVTIQTPGDSNAGNNQASAATFVASPQIALRKLLNGQIEALPPGPEIDQGASITWSYQLTNTGNVTVTALTLTDDRIPSLACLEGSLPDSLPPGATFTCTVQDRAQVGVYTNTAIVSAIPTLGASTPVTATATGHYNGIGYGTLTVVLVADPQQSQPFTFTSSFTQPFALVDGPNTIGDNQLTFPRLRAGEAYTISAMTVDGWMLHSVSCEPGVASTTEIDTASATVTLVAGESLVCTFAQRAILPVLTLVKTVVNDHGGVATAGDFQPLVDGQPVRWGEPITLSLGQHLVSETTLAGYAPSSWGGDCAADGGITLAVGQHKNCTITNDDIPARLIINRSVINDHGGSASAEEFTLWVDGQPIPGTDVITLNAGSHTITTTQSSSYTVTLSGDCTGNDTLRLVLGETKHCTLIADDRPAQLVVEVQVINAYGGVATSDDVTVQVNGQPVTGGVTNTLSAGPVQVSASELPGYTISFEGDCDAAGSVTLGNGASARCRLIFQDRTAILTVTKVVINDHGGTAVAADFPLFVNGSPVTSGNPITLPGGIYTVTEANQQGYAGRYTGDCDAAGTVSLAMSEHKACILINDDLAPTLIISVTVVNDDGGVATLDDLPILLDGTPVSPGVTHELQAGEHTVTVTAPAGYTISYSGDCNAAGQVVLALAAQGECQIRFDDTFASLGDWVWLDQDADGQQDPGEPGLAGVRVILFDDHGVEIATHITDDAGRYRFDGLLPGQYRVEFLPPVGCQFTKPLGSEVESDSNVDPLSPDALWVELGPSAEDWTIDAGLVALTGITGRVWHDLDRDDRQGESEPGVAGVIVALLGGDGEVISTTVTLTDGRYAFVNLLPGDYRVAFAPSSSYGFVQPDAGDDADDSDAERASGHTALISLHSTGQHRLDAGLFTAPQVAFHKSTLQSEIWLASAAGQIVTYTLSFENSGPIAATGVEIHEQVPAATTFVANASTPGWHCADGATAGTPCHYEVGTLLAGAAGEVVFAVQIRPDAMTVENVARLVADGVPLGVDGATIVQEGSATVEVMQPTTLGEGAEPAVGSYHTFLPWVAR
jgi:uncharacterized repeat protein (TIGR01451 family)